MWLSTDEKKISFKPEDFDGTITIKFTCEKLEYAYLAYNTNTTIDLMLLTDGVKILFYKRAEPLVEHLEACMPHILFPTICNGLYRLRIVFPVIAGNNFTPTLLDDVNIRLQLSGWGTKKSQLFWESE